MKMHIEFYSYVQSYIEKYPECGAYVSNYVAKGIELARQSDMQRACDMETALSIALAKRFKQTDAIILDKLQKWEGKTAINFTSTIEKLKKASEK